MNAPRMTLSAVTRGTIERPLRVVLYGVEGIGKSTFGADAPAPVFLGAEDGTAHLDVARFPQPRTWGEAIDVLRVLCTDAHDFKTLVVDTVDWLEPLCWRAVCEAAKKPDIEAFGYGKGYLAALEEWRRFVRGLDALREKGMSVVLLAHALVRPFRNPEGEDYDRYTLKVNEKAAGLLREWADAVLFANYQSFGAKQQNGRAKNIGTGARTLYTTHRPAADAKNRWSLPDELPMGWRPFADALAESRTPARAAALRAQLADALDKLCAVAPQVGASVRVKCNDVKDAHVAEYLNRVRTLINEHTTTND